MSDTSSGWTTSEDDSSGNEYSVRTQKDKLEEELAQERIDKKSNKKKKKKKKKKHKHKHKKSKKKKKSKHKDKDQSDSDSGIEEKKSNNRKEENNKVQVDTNNEMTASSLMNGHVNSESKSPLHKEKNKTRRSRSSSKDRNGAKARSRSTSRSPKSKRYKPPSSYRSPEKLKSKDRSKSRSRSRSRSRSKRRSGSKDRSHKSSRKRSTSTDRHYRHKKHDRGRSRSRSRSRERKYRRSRSKEKRNRSRSYDRKERSRSRDRKRRRSKSSDRKKSRSRSKSYDKKRTKTESPKKDNDKSPTEENVNKTSTSWDVKVTPFDSIRTNGFSSSLPGFIPITASKTNIDFSKENVFTHSRTLDNSTKSIEIKLPSAATTHDAEKKKEDPRSHLLGKWEAYKKPDLNKFTRMCQEISANEGVDNSDVNGNKENVHHPFRVSEAPAYVPPIVPMKTPSTPAEAIMAGSMLSLLAPNAELSGPLEKHFPVSSGTDHRTKCNETETFEDKSNVTVYEEHKPQEEINVSAIIARRLGAQQILQMNPGDYSATLVLTECDQKLKKWSAVNKKPGKFTGEIGVKMNKRAMFQVGNSTESFVKKDFFHNLRPLTGGIGMKMLQNMGWREGQPLGKTMQGFVTPISIDVKIGRAGLTSSEEYHQYAHFQTPTAMPMPMPQQKKRPPPVIQNVAGKHPVSALAEICSKRKMGAPEYAMAEESGPSYCKVFLTKVNVENVWYQPTEPSPNKKHAKAMAAFVALHTLGLIENPGI